MAISKCRVCNKAFFEKPLLKYCNMPKAAQHLPSVSELNSEKGVDIEIFQCNGCGLVQLSNEPVPYYREVIRASAFSNEMKEFRITQFSEFIDKYNLKGKKIVEIGCGKGEYLSLMQSCGTEVSGLEYASDSVVHCIENQLKVAKGFIESSDAKLEWAPFDAFFILNFFEHLPDPNIVLMGIRNNLADEAIGLIEVPNFDMIIRKNLFSEFIPDHLFYFTKDTLCTTLELNGFDVIDCKEIWYDYIISTVVKKRETLNISSFYKHQEKLKKEINQYIDDFPDRKVAIWGAGHQALAFISMTGISDRIRYVVDSAPFKQGKYTPATHLPIVSPESLKSNPVDSIIVIAGAYSDEVVKIIRQGYDERICIAVLRDFGLEFINKCI